LTNSAGASHHGVDLHRGRVRFAAVEAAAQTAGQFTAEWAADGRSVTVRGHCPECRGLTSTEFTRGLVGSKGFRGSTRPRPTQLPSPLTVYCECGYAHEDRPPDALDTGCGRYWWVHLSDADRRPPLPGLATGPAPGSAQP
jgi:hypothetical protein